MRNGSFGSCGKTSRSRASPFNDTSFTVEVFVAWSNRIKAICRPSGASARWPTYQSLFSTRWISRSWPVSISFSSRFAHFWASFIFQITIDLTSRRQKGKCGKGK
jgi:hypothetical protein